MMEEVGLHHYAAGPHQEDANPHQAESRGSQHGNPHRSPERRKGHEGSVRTTHTTKSHSRGKSHVSYAKHDENLQREIADLKRELRHAGENAPHLASNHHPRSRMELVIGRGQELCPVRLSPMKRTIDIGTEARLVGAWVTMP